MAYKFGAEQAEKTYGVGGGSGDRFEFQKGDNRMRILADDKGFLATHFIGNKPYLCVGEEYGCEYHGENAPTDDKGNIKRPSVKKLMYVLSRKSGRIEMAYMPYSVVKVLQGLADDEEWTFDGMPMPYDINIKHDPDAAPAEMYKVFGSPKRDPISEAILQELEKKRPLDQVADKIRSKSRRAPETEEEPVIEEILPGKPSSKTDDDEINVEDIPF